MDLGAVVDRLKHASQRCRLPAGTSVFEPTFPFPDAQRWTSNRDRPGRGNVGLTSHLCQDRPLAVFRANSNRRSDALALDHRDPSTPCRIHLIGSGIQWLGPTWNSKIEHQGSKNALKLVHQQVEPEAEFFEWTFRIPEAKARVTRTILWLKGKRMALLAEQVNAPQGAENNLRLPIAPGLAAEVIAEGRLARLSTRSGALAQVIPLALPTEPEAASLGKLNIQDGCLILEQAPQGRRSWLPLLLRWGGKHPGRPVLWRRLTVSEHSRICPPEKAIAARVSWGRSDHYVFYQSLAKPTLRAFLGHQTQSRCLVGRFQPDGQIKPLINVL